MKKKLRKFFAQFHTLRLRLILATLAIGLVPYTIAAFAFTGLYVSNTLSSEEQRITAQVQPLGHDIVTTGYLADPSDSEINDRIDVMQLLYEGRVLVLNDSLVIIHDSASIDEGRTLIWENATRALQGDSLYYYDSENAFLTVTIPVTKNDGSSEQDVGVIMVVRSMDFMEQNLTELRYAGIIGFVIFAVIITIAAVVIGSKTTQPLKDMGRSLGRIREGMGHGELSIRSYQEAEDLEDEFNDFLGKMQAFDASRQEFVSNVSHELKTPLTSMKVLADSLEGMPDAPVELYQEFMQDMSSEIDRETKIINDLLSLVKMNQSGVTINIASVNMNELVESILKRLRPIAIKARVEVVLESFRPVTVEADETKLSLAITNLVENAIKYNRQDGTGWVHVSLNADHQYCYLRVEDNGMGIPEDSLDHIFERFYRVDKSHSREIGGTGLGLAITHDAIMMHHGEIKVISTLGSGTEFDVRLPLKYIPDEEEEVIVNMVRPQEAARETRAATEAEIRAEEKLTEVQKNLTSDITTDISAVTAHGQGNGSSSTNERVSAFGDSTEAARISAPGDSSAMAPGLGAGTVNSSAMAPDLETGSLDSSAKAYGSGNESVDASSKAHDPGNESKDASSRAYDSGDGTVSIDQAQASGGHDLSTGIGGQPLSGGSDHISGQTGLSDTQKVDRVAIRNALKEQSKAPDTTEPLDIHDIDDNQPLDTDFPSEEEIDRLMAEEDFMDDDEDDDA